jgi:cell division septum initiation protein DivIVA
MLVMTQLQQLAERVEQLLLRHEELQRTNALLGQQVRRLTAERDSLKSTLQSARTRTDHLIDRLAQLANAQSTASQDSTQPIRENPP